MLSNSFKNKKTYGILIGFIAVILLAVVMICYSDNHTPIQNVHFFKSADSIAALENGWTLTDGSISYEITLPSKNEFDIENNTVTLENTLPEALPLNPVILMRTSLQEIKIYIGSELRYTYGGDKFRAFGKNSGSIWNIVPLSDIDVGKSIEVLLYSPYEDYKATFNTFYVGTYEGALSLLFNTYGLNLLFIFTTAIVGLALLLYYTFLCITGMKVANQMLLVSLIAIFTTGWEFTECKLTQIFVSNMAGFSTANFMLLALLFIPIVLYADTIERKNYHFILAPLAYIAEANVLIQAILQLLNIADFYEMMLATHLIIGIGGVIIMITLIRQYLHHREAGIFVYIISMCCLIVGGIIEIFAMYSSGVANGLWLNVSVLIVILSTGVDSIRVALATLQDSKQAMKENAQKTTFLANMSHEIRTPMNAICAMSELLADDKDITAGNRDFARTIHSSAENLLEIINDLLDYSKITADKYSIIDEEYELGDMLSDVKEIISLRAGENHLKFNMHVNPDIPSELFGDQGRIRQILLNLLNNAVKYTNEGEVGLRVEFESIDQSEIILKFLVSDTGIGIKEEDLPDLFEAFVQVDKAKNKSKEGTGLGLAISKALAKMLCGDITVTSEYGKGSVFTATVKQKIRSQKTCKKEIEDIFAEEKLNPIILVESDFETMGPVKTLLTEIEAPFTTCREEDLSWETKLCKNPIVLFVGKDHPNMLTEEFKAENPFMHAVTIAGPLERVNAFEELEIIRYPVTACDLFKMLKPDPYVKINISFEAPDAMVMVVDDNAINLRVMKEMLSKYGIKSTLCSNGNQAVAAARLKPFDLIFIDHMMPGMDGIETASRIRELSQIGNEVKIVALSANAVKGVEKMFKENGFDAFLAKPVSLNSVGKVLKKCLKKDLLKEKSAIPKR